MGTRHQIEIKLDGKKRLQQYGQWDGYLCGQGLDICKSLLSLLKYNGFEKFKFKLRNNVELIDDASYLWAKSTGHNKDYVSMSEAEKFGLEHPLCSRDTGAKALEEIFKSKKKMFALRNDHLGFLEYVYLIDLDQMTLTISDFYLVNRQDKVENWEFKKRDILILPIDKNIVARLEKFDDFYDKANEHDLCPLSASESDWDSVGELKIYRRHLKAFKKAG